MMRTVLQCVAVCWLVILVGCAARQAASEDDSIQYVETDTGRWLVHDVNRPAPPVITPGTASTQSESGKAPSDAIVLFDGTDLSGWTSGRGGPAAWIVQDGYMEVVKGLDSVKTKQAFGSCQLHVEFATPSNINGRAQDQGNSGVFLMSTYEVQILDSYENPTYPDGQCAALYGRAVPLVNACRKPGEWQSYDIIFHRPVFKGEKVVKKATFTVLHNGVLVHDNVQLEGGTYWLNEHRVTEYEPHADKLPLMLQDHDSPVRFRNIWIRELAD
ncbi:hypothetical protein ES703_19032 [subsurface metagenome]